MLHVFTITDNGDDYQVIIAQDEQQVLERWLAWSGLTADEITEQPTINHLGPVQEGAVYTAL